jgi:membrane protein
LFAGFVSVALRMAIKAFSRLIKILTGVYGGAESELSRLERFAHLWALVIRSFVRNRCPVRAAALSYTTLLALIPLLAVAIGVTSSLLKSEGEEQIYQAIDKFISAVVPPPVLSGTNEPTTLGAGTNLAGIALLTNAPAIESLTNAPAETSAVAPAGTDARMATQKEVARYIRDFVQKTRSGALGTIGMLLLVVVAIQLLANVEETFNDIWGVTRGRNWLWRIVLYWTTITLGPLALAGALGLAGGKHLAAAENLVNQMPFISNLFFQFLPLLVLWLTFTLIYQLVPNTKVQFRAAFVGGVVGGSLWHLNNIFGFIFVSRVFSNRTIYGSLGLVPVFMIGLYFSWVILLFGAQVAYAFQNRKAYLQDKLAENVNQRGREFVALRLMTCVGQRFQNGLPPVTIQEISAELGIPTRLAQQVVQTLLAARLVTEIAGAESAYAPARPLEAINAHHILQAMRSGGGQELPSQNEPARAEVYGEFARIEEAERQAAASITMLALVSRARARLEIAAPPLEREKQISPAPTVESSSSSSPAAAKRSEDGSSSKLDDAQSRTKTKDENETRETAGDINETPAVAQPPVVLPAEKRAVVVPEDGEFPL